MPGPRRVSRRFLGDADKAAIEARVAALEQALGIEVVTVVTARSDAYPQIVWRAFALGAAFAATRGQNRAAGAGPHPGAEAVRAAPPAVARLERALAHGITPSKSKCVQLPGWAGGSGHRKMATVQRYVSGARLAKPAVDQPST